MCKFENGHFKVSMRLYLNNVAAQAAKRHCKANFGIAAYTQANI